MDKERIIQGVVGFLDDNNIDSDVVRFVEVQMEKLYQMGYDNGYGLGMSDGYNECVENYE